MGIFESAESSPDSREYKIGKKTVHMASYRNAIFISRKAMTNERSPEKLSEICPFISENFSQLLFSWEPILNQMPQWLRPFLRNPTHPFSRIHTIYTFKNGSLNEFSTATTGKVESDEFLRQFARQLFHFKIYLQKMGFESTIKMKSEKDLIYISTDFENIQQNLTSRFGSHYKFLAGLFKPYISRAQCYINRTLFNGETKGLCPAGGKTEANPFSGLIECSVHKGIPTAPVFVDEAACCRYNRLRLEAVIADRNLNTPENRKDLNFLKALAKKLQIHLCPTDGVWSLDEKGHIGCTDHEN